MVQDDLINRIRKRFKIVHKYAVRFPTNTFRVYHRDLPDFPFILDWYHGQCVCWLYDRKRDETDAQKAAYARCVTVNVLTALEIPESNLYIKYRRQQKGIQSQYLKMNRKKKTTIVSENNLAFEINLSDYLDTGLFLDHRSTRKLCRQWAKGHRFLNLFAYTGSFTCNAIAGGASQTTSVDLSGEYCDWTIRNFELNQFDPTRHAVIKDNCLSFVQHEAGKKRYDLIVCDPPTFSNSKQMKTSFSVTRDYPSLVRSCIKLLSPGGRLIFSTNAKTFTFDPSLFSERHTIQNITSLTTPFEGHAIHKCWTIQKSSL